MENENILLQTINGLLQKTIEGKIPWKTVNANAIRWTKPGTGGATPIVVTLQKQQHPQPLNPQPPHLHYFLSVQAQGAQATQITSLANPELKDILSKLYQEASKISNSVSIQILKNLLDGL
ncbi:MAG TPA: hypothetical protein PKC72_13790 [Chitinophagaceae bacterium]|nr:hypothetical protein [Chitinophagaceae bacterium]